MTHIIANTAFALVYITISLLMKFKPPKKIDLWYGYRTLRSMESQAKWDKAHQLFGKYLWRTLPITITVHILLLMITYPFAILFISLIFVAEMIGIIVLVEQQLKKA